LIDEYRVRSALTNNPNINALTDARYDSGAGFYVTTEPLCEGSVDKVDEYIRGKKPMPFERLVKYVQNIANGLNGLREIDLIHNDLKPANILIYVNELGEKILRLTDFAQSPEIVLLSRLAGTVNMGYPTTMPPELLCSANAPSPKTDVWAIGPMAYHWATVEEMFSMRFEGSDSDWAAVPIPERIKVYDRRILDKIKELGQDGISHMIDNIDFSHSLGGEMKQILKGCTTIDLSQRYSCEELLERTNRLYAKVCG